MFAASERAGQGCSPEHVKHCAWSIVSLLSAAGGQLAMRRDLRGSEPSVSGEGNREEYRIILMQWRQESDVSRETLRVEHRLALVSGRRPVSDERRSQRKRAKRAWFSRCSLHRRAGQGCSPEHVDVSRETLCVEHRLTLVSGRRPVSDERRSQRKRAERAW
jgi:hypothetical protein